MTDDKLNYWLIRLQI